MKFKYIALNQKQKKLAGTIDAPTEVHAREQLNKLGLAVLQIQDISNLEQKNDTNRFNFEARDPNQKKVVGTIAAKDKISALNRLTKEYELEVFKLYGHNATETEIANSSIEVARLKQQLQALETTQSKNDALKKEEQENQYRNKLTKEAEKIITQVQGFLQKYQNKLKESDQTYIQDQVDHIQKILHTKNIENLKLSCENLLSYIQDKELFLEQTATLAQKTNLKIETQTLLQELRDIKKQSKTVKIRRKTGFWATFKDIFGNNTPEIAEHPELVTLELQADQAWQEMMSYFKLFLSASKKQYRTQAQKAIRPLFRKWWRIKHQYKLLYQKLHGKKAKEATSGIHRISLYIISCYLVLYFVLHFLSIKQFSLNVPDFVYVHYTAILMYSIIGAFLLHTAAYIADQLEAKANPLSNLSYIVAAITFLFIWLNF